jgi:large subunit ribosomal protein L30
VDAAVVATVAGEDVAVKEVRIVAEAKKTGKAKADSPKTLKVTWVRSGIGYSKDQKATIQSLGLHRLNETVERPDSPQVRGQINKVRHMLSVEES